MSQSPLIGSVIQIQKRYEATTSKGKVAIPSNRVSDSDPEEILLKLNWKRVAIPSNRVSDSDT